MFSRLKGNIYSRYIFQSFFKTIEEAEDRFSGGAIQLVGIYRNSKSQTFGIVQNNEKFIYGHKLNNVEVINSNIQLNTKIVSTRTTYIDNVEKQNELERVLKSDIIYPDEIEDNDLFERTKK